MKFHKLQYRQFQNLSAFVFMEKNVKNQSAKPMKTKRRFRLILPLIAFFLIPVLTVTARPLTTNDVPNDSSYIHQDSTAFAWVKVDSIIAYGKKYLGKPYLYKPAEGRVFDCSGFIGYIYGTYGFNLPRSSASIASVSKKVGQSEITRGDLLFFKGRNLQSERVGHVAMVVSVDGNDIEMMHSCSSGIVIERYNSSNYYASRFLFAGRLPQLTAPTPLQSD
jgi:cell wall-associated NlpC family hydrolase